ncbi:hypothetical protein MMC07_000243 [Pseudocyphellaria aurata]|nr:hypothetical protein [Pseudocyphellaria aurata]
MESPARPSDHQSHFEKRDDGAGVADDAASPSSLLTPVPKTRADDILNRLKKLHLTSEDLKNLYPEKRRGPVVMLPLAGDYYVSFGLPRLAREPVDWGTGPTKIDTHDIHPFLSAIKRTEGSLRGLGSDVPKVVFDIGRLHIKLKATAPNGDAYEPCYYRVLLDMVTRAIWLCYEYYQYDPDLQEEKVDFCMNEVLEERVDCAFDTAKILDSITEWTDGLKPATIEKNMRESGAMARAHLTAFLYAELEAYPKAPRE